MTSKQRFLIAIALLLAGCGGIYTSDSIEATVIDGETKTPLAGVSVIAYWPVYGGLEGGVYVKNLKIMEAQTDATGRFYFPSWGPVWSRGIVRRSIPNLLFFKAGYMPKEVSNQLTTRIDSEWSERMRSDWNGKAIELTAGASRDRYVDALRVYDQTLTSISEWYDRRCDWPKIARTIVVLESEYQSLESLGDLATNTGNAYRDLISNESAIQSVCQVSPSTTLKAQK